LSRLGASPGFAVRVQPGLAPSGSDRDSFPSPHSILRVYNVCHGIFEITIRLQKFNVPLGRPYGPFNKPS